MRSGLPLGNRVPGKLVHVVTRNEYVSGGGKEVVEAQIKPLESSSFYSTSEVTVVYDDGNCIKLFLKDYARYKWSKSNMEERAEREISVYRDILQHHKLNTPGYYGSASPERKKKWLLMEYVKGTQLGISQGDKPWFATILWLAKMQSLFYENFPNSSIASNVLIAHDAQFFVSAAERALRRMSRASLEQARRLEKIIDLYPQVVSRMVTMPRTLVHGSFRPADILISGSSKQPRVCAVDWEQAGWGAPLYDLAYLIGDKKGKERQRLLAAYLRVAKQFGLVGAMEETARIFDGFRLHRLFVILRKAGRHSHQASFLPDIVDRVDEIELSLKRWL